MKHFLVLLSLSAFFLSACKTSKDIKADQDSAGTPDSMNELGGVVDSAGVRTLDAPPVAVVAQNAAQSDSQSNSQPEQVAQVVRPVNRVEVDQDLMIARGEIENLQYQLQQRDLQHAEEMKNLQEENERLKEALNTLGQQKQAAPKVVTTSSKGGMDEQLWNKAREAIKAKNYDTALTAVVSIRQTYKKSKYFWGATLANGMLLYEAGQLKEAALIFDEAIDLASRRKRGVSLPWYFQGLTFYRLGQKQDAELFWDELTRRYPRANVSLKLAALKKKGNFTAPKNPFTHLPNWETFARP